jgi:hypothetical protein
MARQTLPDDERAAIERHLRELDRLGEGLPTLDRRRERHGRGGAGCAIGEIRRFARCP